MNKCNQLSSRQIEICIVVLIWVIVLVWPLGIAYFTDVANGHPFDKQLMSDVYMYIFAFLVLFLLHRYVVMPYIYRMQKTWLSVISTFLLLVLFAVFLKSVEPSRRFRHERPQMERMMEMEHREPRPRPHGDMPPKHKEKPHEFQQMSDNKLLLNPPDMARMIIAFLMIGANIGIGAVLNANQQKKRLLQLEQQSLKQELESLKHQISPHFFMNTLNNIHALIDIDQEKAKRSLVELSQIMRYMLYDGTGPTVSLNREIEYLERYISLMKLRYNEKVEILCQFQRDETNLQIPPLLLVTFVENAFKHGVSYREQSFIYVNLDVIDEGRYLHFSCTNSRHDNTVDKEQGGIGLDNVRKRLNLIYGQDYRLEVDSGDASQYAVNLFIPTKLNPTCPSVV